MNQSIDVSKYYGGGDFRTVDDETFTEGMNAQVEDYYQGLSDLKMVLTDEFQDPIKKI